MKKLLNILGLALALLFSGASYGATASLAAAANINQLVPLPAKINSISITASTTNNVTLTFYDAPYTNLTYVVSSYTLNVLSAPTNYVNVYTNVYGTVERWTNTVIRSTATTVAASTNTFPLLFQMVVPTNSTATYTPTTRLFTAYGLTVTNNQPATIVVDYSQ